MTAIRKQVMVHEDHKLHLDLDIPTDVPVGMVEVTLYVKPANKPDPQKAAACLRDIAARGNLRNGPDPAQWQRKIRQDRLLPGRE